MKCESNKGKKSHGKRTIWKVSNVDVRQYQKQ